MYTLYVVTDTKAVQHLGFAIKRPIWLCYSSFFNTSGIQASLHTTRLFYRVPALVILFFVFLYYRWYPGQLACNSTIPRVHVLVMLFFLRLCSHIGYWDFNHTYLSFWVLNKWTLDQEFTLLVVCISFLDLCLATFFMLN